MNKTKNIYLVIALITIIIIAVALTIAKTLSASKETTAEVEKYQQEEEQEKQNETLVIDIETEENVQEIFEEEEESEEKQEKNNKAKYFIRINYTQNVVTIYEKDSSGNYTKPVKVMLCSTGTATPRSGTYSISDKYKWGRLNGGVSGQYCTRIVKSILFHSVPYLTYGDKSSLEYWEYDKLGTTASAGCIRLTVQDAKWIYQNCEKGTQVEFYSDSNPGPLGKPSEQKISEEEAVRGWDPTDPDDNNPWKTYAKEDDEEVKPDESDKTNKPNENITQPSTPEEKPGEGENSGETTTPEEKPGEGENSGETTTPEEKPGEGENSDETTTPEEKPEQVQNSGEITTPGE